jgi:hypothetical protein
MIETLASFVLPCDIIKVGRKNYMVYSVETLGNLICMELTKNGETIYKTFDSAEWVKVKQFESIV